MIIDVKLIPVISQYIYVYQIIKFYTKINTVTHISVKKKNIFNKKSQINNEIL